MQSQGSTTPGGPLNIRAVPFPVDPTIQFTRPEPPPRQPRTTTPIQGRKGRTRPLTDSERQAVRDMWAAGDPGTRIAMRLGCSTTTVWKIIADARKAEGEAS